MYLVYKNAYKRPFCLNIKTLKRRKMKGVTSMVSSPNPAGRSTLGNDNNNNAGGRSFGDDDRQENASQFNNNF